MSGTAYGLPTFTENNKFDRSNWIAFKNLIIVATEVCGAIGYLDGSIRDPTTIIQSPNPPDFTLTMSKPKQTQLEATPWYSDEPSAGEWRTRNAWAKGLLLYNICNPIGLGVNVLGTTKAVWKLLTNLYDRSSEIAKLHAKEKLQSLWFHDRDDFSTHIAQLQLLWQKVNAMGDLSAMYLSAQLYLDPYQHLGILLLQHCIQLHHLLIC